MSTHDNSALTDLELFSDRRQYSSYDNYRERQAATDQEQLLICKHLGRNRAVYYCNHGFVLACTTCDWRKNLGGYQSGFPNTKLHSRQMGCCAVAPSYTPLSLAAGAKSSLTKIDVTQYMLGDDGVAVLMKVLKAMGVHLLTLIRSLLTLLRPLLTLQAIAAVTTLTTLDLRDNLIGTHPKKYSLHPKIYSL
jgi:hypothetical protein